MADLKIPEDLQGAYNGPYNRPASLIRELIERIASLEAERDSLKQEVYKMLDSAKDALKSCDLTSQKINEWINTHKEYAPKEENTDADVSTR